MATTLITGGTVVSATGASAADVSSRSKSSVTIAGIAPARSTPITKA